MSARKGEQPKKNQKLGGPLKRTKFEKGRTIQGEGSLGGSFFFLPF